MEVSLSIVYVNWQIERLPFSSLRLDRLWAPTPSAHRESLSRVVDRPERETASLYPFLSSRMSGTEHYALSGIIRTSFERRFFRIPIGTPIILVERSRGFLPCCQILE
jgi:hypothetical protein